MDSDWASKKLTVSEARRLHDEAACMTVAELRRFAHLYGLGAWVSNAKKKVILAGFKERLERFVERMGEKIED